MPALTFDHVSFFIPTKVEEAIQTAVDKLERQVKRRAIAFVLSLASFIVLLVFATASAPSAWMWTLLVPMVVGGFSLVSLKRLATRIDTIRTNPDYYAMKHYETAHTKDSYRFDTLPSLTGVTFTSTALTVRLNDVMEQLRVAFEKLYQLRQRLVAANGEARLIRQLTDLYTDVYFQAQAQLSALETHSSQVLVAEGMIKSFPLAEVQTAKLTPYLDGFTNQCERVKKLAEEVATYAGAYKANVEAAERQYIEGHGGDAQES